MISQAPFCHPDRETCRCIERTSVQCCVQMLHHAAVTGRKELQEPQVEGTPRDSVSGFSQRRKSMRDADEGLPIS